MVSLFRCSVMIWLNVVPANCFIFCFRWKKNLIGMKQVNKMHKKICQIPRMPEHNEPIPHPLTSSPRQYSSNSNTVDVMHLSWAAANTLLQAISSMVAVERPSNGQRKWTHDKNAYLQNNADSMHDGGKRLSSKWCHLHAKQIHPRLLSDVDGRPQKPHHFHNALATLVYYLIFWIKLP